MDETLEASAPSSATPPGDPAVPRSAPFAPSTTESSSDKVLRAQNTIDEEDKTYVRWPGGSTASAIHIGGSVRKQFGDYELVRELARGGMGVVYEAVQTRLNRTVAVKMILSGEFASDEQVQRFFAEARSVANLDHPNIIPVYEVAEEAGLHFFSMKLVDGGSLSGRLSSFRGNMRLSAELVEKVARAIHHAHQRGVLHRDLKPANILLDKDGEPLVTDFGLAKIVADDSNVTRSDAIVGTPAYMAPEQARGARYATTATDIWALGAILYHLLTGVQPFRGETSHATLKLVTETEPVTPRQRDGRIPRDLETICLKCLQKEPARRYPTADALAADLRRFLAGEPVEARPVGTFARIWRWGRRNPGLAATGAAALVAAAAAIVILSVSVVLISDREQRASKLASDNAVLLDSERALSNARQRDNVNLRLEQAVKQCEIDAPAGLLTLARILANAESLGADDLALSTRLQIAAWGRAIHPLRCIVRHEPAGAGGVRLVALSADGSIAFTEGADNHVRAFDTATGGQIGDLENDGPASAIAADPTSGLLLIGFRDGTSRWWHADADRRLPAAAPRHADGKAITAIRFAATSGQVLTAGEDGVARLWSTTTGEQVGHERAHGRPITTCAVSEYANRIATAGDDGSVRLWEFTTVRSVGKVAAIEPVLSLAFRDRGHQLVVVSQTSATLYDARTGRAQQVLRQPPDGTFASTIAPDGVQLLASDWGSIARVVSLSGPRQTQVPLRHGDNVTAQAFSADGRTMITGSVDGLARVWSLAEVPDAISLQLQGAPASGISRDGRRIAVGTSDGHIAVFNARTGREITRFTIGGDSGIGSIAISPDGKRVLASDNNMTVRLFDIPTRMPVGEPIEHADRVSVVAFSTDGLLLLTGSFDGRLQVRSASDLSPIGEPIEHELLRTALFSPDGISVVTAGDDGIARLWEVGPDRPEPLLFQHEARIWAVAFNSDGSRLATGGHDGLARLWDAFTAKPVGQPMAHQDQVQFLAFSPTDEWLATGESSRVVRMWNAHTGQARRQPIPLADRPTCLAFSDDGHRLIIGAFDGSAVLWDVAGHRAIGPTLHGHSTISGVGFIPGGNAAMIASLGGDIRLHPVDPQLGTPAEVLSWASGLTGLELDAGGAVRVRQEPTAAR